MSNSELSAPEEVSAEEQLAQVKRTLQQELQYGEAYLDGWESGRYSMAEMIARQIGFVPEPAKE